MVAVGCRLEPFPLFDRNASQFHQRSGFMLAATKSKGFQFLGHPAAAVCCLRFLVKVSNLGISYACSCSLADGPRLFQW